MFSSVRQETKRWCSWAMTIVITTGRAHYWKTMNIGGSFAVAYIYMFEVCTRQSIKSFVHSTKHKSEPWRAPTLSVSKTNDDIEIKIQTCGTKNTYSYDQNDYTVVRTRAEAVVRKMKKIRKFPTFKHSIACASVKYDYTGMQLIL
jgi:hypothetical protein